MKNFAESKNKELSKAICNSVCCITSTGATGAYIGALAGRSIHMNIILLNIILSLLTIQSISGDGIDIILGGSITLIGMLGMTMPF